MNIETAKVTPVDVVEHCYVCGAGDYKPVYTIRGWHIVKCRCCGFMFVNPRYNEASADAIYNEEGWYFSTDGGKKNYAVEEVASIQRAEKAISQIASFKSGKLSLLDVGCGLGYVLEAGRKVGWDVTGIDLSHEGVAACREKGLAAFQGDVKSAALDPSKTFDVITALDVFEHVCDPLAFLADLKARLSKDGMIVLQVPNVRSLGRYIHGTHWQGFVLPEHLNYFGSVTMRKILERQGYSVREVFSEPSISLGLRNVLRAHFKQSGPMGRVVDAITLLKRYVFYPPMNWLFRKTALEANMLVVFAQAKG